MTFIGKHRMTIIQGVTISEAVCCGRQYASTRYLTIHIDFSTCWSDGWQEEGSIWGNVEGLCQCTCGQYLIHHRDLSYVGKAEQSNLPRLQAIEAYRLPKCIEETRGTDLERLARIAYWRNLNQTYRDTYFEQQALHEARAKFEWEQANPDRRSWWKKLCGQPAPAYRKAGGNVFPPPPFKPSARQVDNMSQLCELLIEECSDDVLLTLAELQRELGRFDEALATLQRVGEAKQNSLYALIQRLASEENPAPMRVLD